jgi:hypothetical protein
LDEDKEDHRVRGHSCPLLGRFAAVVVLGQSMDRRTAQMGTEARSVGHDAKI